MAVYFTSDLHIGHRSICKYRDRFKDADEHHEYMINKILELSKRDILFIIGDFLFDGPDYFKHIEKLKNKKCRIKLVLGNHDAKELYYEDIFEIQLPLFNYKSMWVSHCPIHPQELRNRAGCIHGHLHSESVKKREYDIIDDCEHLVPDPRYFNVNIEDNNYEFVKLETIKEYFEN